eukprot:scaffold190503_cov26-Tisochrysis_lutea.AAC.2
MVAPPTASAATPRARPRCAAAHSTTRTWRPVGPLPLAVYFPREWPHGVLLGVMPKDRACCSDRPAVLSPPAGCAVEASTEEAVFSTLLVPATASFVPKAEASRPLRRPLAPREDSIEPRWPRIPLLHRCAGQWSANTA